MNLPQSPPFSMLVSLTPRQSAPTHSGQSSPLKAWDGVPHLGGQPPLIPRRSLSPPPGPPPPPRHCCPSASTFWHLWASSIEAQFTIFTL